MRVALLSACLFFVLPSSASAKFLTLNEIGEASCRVNADDSRGSGTAIAQDKQFVYVLTNAHVVGNSSRVTCEFFRYGRKTRPLGGEVLWRAYSERRVLDFAVIKIARSLFGSMPPRIVPLAPAGHLIKKNDYIASAGCPQARWLQLWEGHALSDSSQSQVLFTPPPLGGQSGSGVYTVIKGNTYLAAVLTWRVDEDKGGAIHIANFWRAIRGEVSENKFDRVPLSWKFAADTSTSKAKKIEGKTVRKRAYYARGSNGYYYLQTFKDGIQWKSVTIPNEHKNVRIIEWNILLDSECPFGGCPHFNPPQKPRPPPDNPHTPNPDLPIPNPEDNPDGSPGGDGEGDNPFGEMPPNYTPDDPSSKIKELQDRIKELEKESATLKSERVELEKTIADLNETIQSKLSAIEDLKSDAIGNRSKIEKLEGELSEHLSELDSLNSALSLKNEELRGSLQSIEDLKNNSSGEIEEVKNQRNIFGWIGSAISAILLWVSSLYWRLRGKKQVAEVVEDIEEIIEDVADGDDDDGDVEVAPASPTPEAPDMHALADFLEDRIGVLFGQQVAPALNAVNEKIDRMQGQIDSHVESDHKPAETPVHVVQCPEAREALKEEEESPPPEDDCDCDCSDTILDQVRNNPEFPEATVRIRQFIDLKTADGECVRELAFYAHLYKDAVVELKNNRLIVQRQGKPFKVHHQSRAADAIESYVKEEFLKRISSATLDSHCLYHEAMIGFLYKEAVKKLRRGEFNVLGYKDIAFSIDEWVKTEFLRRMGFQF